MDDTLRGILVTLTIASLFITCIVNFVVIFPQEQGANFTSSQDQAGYLAMTQVDTETSTASSLSDISGKVSNATDNWDITVGFMGSNTLKQSSTGISGYSSNVFKNIKLMATYVFGENSPLLYVIVVLTLLASGYIIYAIIQFVRTGR